MKKSIKKSNKVALPANMLPSQADIETKLKETGGLLTYTARGLGLTLEDLKKAIRKNRYLRNLVFDLRESMIDLAEDTLMYRMAEKKDGIVAMYVTKCLGKDRGWIEKPEKAGSNAEKPIYIKILPIGENGDIKKGPGRPSKKFAEVKLPAVTALPMSDEEKAVKEIVEAEVLD